MVLNGCNVWKPLRKVWNGLACFEMFGNFLAWFEMVRNGLKWFRVSGTLLAWSGIVWNGF